MFDALIGFKKGKNWIRSTAFDQFLFEALQKISGNDKIIDIHILSSSVHHP
jgi:hypothetical protein